jgi:hypothetical protein
MGLAGHVVELLWSQPLGQRRLSILSGFRKKIRHFDWFSSYSGSRRWRYCSMAGRCAQRP